MLSPKWDFLPPRRERVLLTWPMCPGEGPQESTEPQDRAEPKEGCREVEVRATTWAVCKTAS